MVRFWRLLPGPAGLALFQKRRHAFTAFVGHPDARDPGRGGGDQAVIDGTVGNPGIIRLVSNS